MRVLWFSNTPSLAVKAYNNSTVGGSWIESLEYELLNHSNIELGIAFKHLAKAPEVSRSKTSGTQYFMVPRHPFKKFDRWLSRFMVLKPSEKSLKEYLNIVESFKPDVVLFFGTESDFPLIIPKLKVPSVIWFQGNLTVYEQMYENGISVKKTISNENLKDLIMGDSIFHRFRRFKLLVKREKRIFSFAQNFIGRTDWDRRLVNIMAPQANYFHCDEAMRRPFMDNIWSFNENREKFVIATTISGNLYKGLEMVYKSCQFLSNLIKKTIEWRVIGIADGTAYVKTSQQIADYKNSENMVKLLGRKTDLELLDELLNADVYVHPSHIENSPNSVQEAMLLGMPVVATNVGGTPSLMIDGEEGYLVQSNDHYALAGAIMDVFVSPIKAKSMGAMARKRGLVRNNSEVICADLLQIFEKLNNSPNL